MAGEPLAESKIFLSTLPAERAERRLALAVALASLAVFAAVAPFARTALAAVPAFLPIYQSALVVCDLVTAILLFGQFRILRSRALLALGGAYVFSAAMAISHALSFPGLFSPTGLLGAGPQTTAWLYFLWHLGFPAALIWYALAPASPSIAHGGSAVAVAATLAIAVGTAVLFTLLATAGQDALPPIMQANDDLPAKYVVAWVTWLATLAAVPLLWRRRPLSVLDLWLLVVICAWLCDVALAAVLNAGRYSVGWYAGRVYGLAASSFVLVVLLLENSTLYARLAGLNESLERRIAARTAELEASREELREMAAVGANAREQEKQRIARELHDELGQALTALKIDLALLQQKAVSAEETASRLSAMQEIVDEMVSSTRRIAADLRPRMLDDLGLVPAAQWLVETFKRQHAIEIRLSIDPPEFEVRDPQSTAVYRILQESLTNIARHARASAIELRLSRADGEIRLRVRDNGRGFDPSAPRRPNSFGLLGLRERANLVSGTIAIETAPGRGTTIDVAIPVPHD